MVGECRWRSRPVDPDLLDDLLAYKLPALHQAGHRPGDDLRILLFSRSGYGLPVAVERKVG